MLVVVAAAIAPVSSYWWSLSASAERSTSCWKRPGNAVCLTHASQ